MLVDLRSSKILDSATNLTTNTVSKLVNFCSISTIDKCGEFSDIISNYPEVTNVNVPTILSSCTTAHHIHIRGPPRAQRARRLPPKKLKVAKAQFKDMM